jgi:hypothetical protein
MANSLKSFLISYCKYGDKSLEQELIWNLLWILKELVQNTKSYEIFDVAYCDKLCQEHYFMNGLGFKDDKDEWRIMNDVEDQNVL